MVDGVIEYSAEASLQIKSENYNIVINTDAAPKSAMLAESAHGDLKLGFGYNKKGYVYPFNKEAQKWFEMGLFDDVKKANTHAYQKIILDMLCLKPSNYEIILKLSEDEKVFSKNFAELNGIKDKDLKIGLNTGAGSRWEFKKWTVEGFSILIDMINNEYPNSKILLYGGPEEKERNCLLAKKHNDIIIDTGYKNSIREFIALVDICDILVTGDTMALHIALALKKKILVLMGPTSSAEIHLYDRGKIVQADINCSCCYRQTCNNKPNCMELITPEMVFEALKEQID
jgi:heptosyltransferase-2